MTFPYPRWTRVCTAYSGPRFHSSLLLRSDVTSEMSKHLPGTKKWEYHTQLLTNFALEAKRFYCSTSSIILETEGFWLPYRDFERMSISCVGVTFWRYLSSATYLAFCVLKMVSLLFSNRQKFLFLAFVIKKFGHQKVTSKLNTCCQVKLDLSLDL